MKIIPIRLRFARAQLLFAFHSYAPLEQMRHDTIIACYYSVFSFTILLAKPGKAKRLRQRFLRPSNGPSAAEHRRPYK